MSQLGSARIASVAARAFRSHRKIWICFAADTAALLRKILTLRPPRKRSMIKFRRQNLDYAGKISSKFKGSQAARALINPYGPMSRCDPRI